MEIKIRDKKKLSEKEIRAIVELLCLIWPPKELPLNLEIEQLKYRAKPLIGFYKTLLCMENGFLIGYTEVFERKIFAGNRKINNLALAGVCVHPEYRNQDIGKRLVTKAFEFVDNGRFECSVFQTGVPLFYEKLNCRLINNRFVNGLDESNAKANPWWDEHVMIYPEAFEIGNDIIDLNGKGY